VLKIAKIIDATEDRKKAQYFVLEYIVNDQQQQEDHHITNVEDYKKDLYVYPLSERLNPFNALCE